MSHKGFVALMIAMLWVWWRMFYSFDLVPLISSFSNPTDAMFSLLIAFIYLGIPLLVFLSFIIFDLDVVVPKR